MQEEIIKNLEEQLSILNHQNQVLWDFIKMKGLKNAYKEYCKEYYEQKPEIQKRKNFDAEKLIQRCVKDGFSDEQVLMLQKGIDMNVPVTQLDMYVADKRYLAEHMQVIIQGLKEMEKIDFPFKNRVYLRHVLKMGKDNKISLEEMERVCKVIIEQRGEPVEKHFKELEEKYQKKQLTGKKPKKSEGGISR